MSSTTGNDIPGLVRSLLATLEALEQTHVELAWALEAQLEAMKRFDSDALTVSCRRQEQIQRRVLKLDQERRRRTAMLARRVGISESSSLTDLAAQLTDFKDVIAARRSSLREKIEEVVRQNITAARTARGVLGHLNFALRLVTRSDTYAATGAIAPVLQPARLSAVA